MTNKLSIFGRLITSSGKSSFLIFQEYSVLKEIQHFGSPFSQCQRQWSRTFIFHFKKKSMELVQVLVAAVMWVVCFQVNIRFGLSSKDHGSFVEVKEKKKKKKPFVPWFLQHPPLIPPLGLNYEFFWMCPGLQFWVSLGCFFQRYIPKISTAKEFPKDVDVAPANQIMIPSRHPTLSWKHSWNLLKFPALTVKSHSYYVTTRLSQVLD